MPYHIYGYDNRSLRKIFYHVLPAKKETTPSSWVYLGEKSCLKDVVCDTIGSGTLTHEPRRGETPFVQIYDEYGVRKLKSVEHLEEEG